MSASIALRVAIEERAKGRCEYCQAPMLGGYRFHIDHIIPVSSGGTIGPANLALACATCNLAKSAKTSGTDPMTGLLVPLFNPRTQRWEDHFQWRDRARIEGVTAVGRVTVLVVQMNSEVRAKARALWFAVGALP